MINALRTEFLIITMYNVVECYHSVKPEKKRKKDIWLLARACQPWSKFHKFLMRYTCNLDFQHLGQDLAPGLRLPAPESAPRRLHCFETVNALCWYRDFHISARFESWLKPFGSGVSA